MAKITYSRHNGKLEIGLDQMVLGNLTIFSKYDPQTPDITNLKISEFGIWNVGVKPPSLEISNLVSEEHKINTPRFIELSTKYRSIRSRTSRCLSCRLSKWLLVFTSNNSRLATKHVSSKSLSSEQDSQVSDVRLAVLSLGIKSAYSKQPWRSRKSALESRSYLIVPVFCSIGVSRKL